MHSGGSGSIVGSPGTSLATESLINHGGELEDLSVKGCSSQTLTISAQNLSLMPSQYLVPLWECLQEVYKPLSLQLKGGALDFHGLLPDMLFADLPPSAVIAVPEDYMVGVKIQEDKGMFMRYYYLNSYSGGDSVKAMGAEKTVESSYTRNYSHYMLCLR